MCIRDRGIPPSRADAEKAAAVLEEAGVSQVMLFGSVARNHQTPESNIDLVAIYNDLDYAERTNLAESLSRDATKKVGYDVTVRVTDRPEWTKRINCLETSMERQIASYGQLLVDQPPVGVNYGYGKEIVLPLTPEGEAEAWIDIANEKIATLGGYLVDVLDSLREGQPDAKVACRSSLIWASVVAHDVVTDSIRALIHLESIPGATTWGSVEHLADQLRSYAVRLLLYPPGTRLFSDWHSSTRLSLPLPMRTYGFTDDDNQKYLRRFDDFSPSVRGTEALVFAAIRCIVYANTALARYQTPPARYSGRVDGVFEMGSAYDICKVLEVYDLRTGRSSDDQGSGDDDFPMWDGGTCPVFITPTRSSPSFPN